MTTGRKWPPRGGPVKRTRVIIVIIAIVVIIVIVAVPLQFYYSKSRYSKSTFKYLAIIRIRYP